VKLTKPQIKAHKEAMALVDCDRSLHDEEKEFILDNFHEGATNINSAAGAFFTPRGLARDLAVEVGDAGRLVDLCAGIGSLSYAIGRNAASLVCVEINPEYARIGQRVVPEAEWLVCSAFDARVLALPRFRWAISNPPFGAIKGDDYTGSYKVIELASRLADFGAFILPQMSAPFRYSGQQTYTEEESPKVKAFREQTGIVMEPSCGFDTSIYKNEWRGVSPACEIVVCEFEKPVFEVEQRQLFEVAA
jgi:predicted RNA methylase